MEHTPTEMDIQLVFDLSSEMSSIFDSEQQRMSTFRKIMTKHGLEIQAGATEGSPFTTDRDMLKYFCYCLVEGKNEAGSGDAEPIFPGATSYASFMTEASKKQVHARLPALVLYLVGAHLGVVGAVFTDRPNMQVLVRPLPLFWHHTDVDMRTTAARYVGALKKAIDSLRQYYGPDLSTVDSIFDDPRFPYKHQYTSLHDGTTCIFKYKSQVDDQLVFFGETDHGDNICISKFVHGYSKEAHLKCASMGCAPSLRGFEKLPGGWYMVVMDDIGAAYRDFTTSDATPILREHMKQKIVSLHQAGFVHGDIRDANTLVKEDGEHPIMLVDFDWAGPIGEAKYPMNLNRAGLWRPDGARDGNIILADHDMEMLDAMFGVKS